MWPAKFLWRWWMNPHASTARIVISSPGWTVVYVTCPLLGQDWKSSFTYHRTWSTELYCHRDSKAPIWNSLHLNTVHCSVFSHVIIKDIEALYCFRYWKTLKIPSPVNLLYGRTRSSIWLIFSSVVADIGQSSSFVCILPLLSSCTHFVLSARYVFTNIFQQSVNVCCFFPHMLCAVSWQLIVPRLKFPFLQSV